MYLDEVAREHVGEVVDKNWVFLSDVLKGDADFNRNNYGDPNAEILC